MMYSSRSPIVLGRCLSLAGSLLVASLPASGEIVGSFVLNADGTATYFYRVDNRAGLFDISQWSLEFEFANPDWTQLDTFSGGEVEVPDPNWFADSGVPILGQSAQDFLSIASSGDVLIGAVLGGFSFTSAYLPGVITYYEFSALGESMSGTTLGPVAVPVIPEAGGWAWGLAAATCIASASLLKRSRAMRPGQNR